MKVWYTGVRILIVGLLLLPLLSGLGLDLLLLVFRLALLVEIRHGPEFLVTLCRPSSPAQYPSYSLQTRSCSGFSRTVNQVFTRVLPTVGVVAQFPWTRSMDIGSCVIHRFTVILITK